MTPDHLNRKRMTATVPIAEVEVAVVDEDLEEDVTETVHDLDDEEDLGELLAVDDEAGA